MMKNLFLMLFGTLILFTQVLHYRFEHHKDRSGKTPVLYWATDPNPNRHLQVKGFRAWLAARNLPDVEIKIDPVNAGGTKVILQAVTGVADDLVDGDLYTYDDIGILAPITEPWGVDIPIYPALRHEILREGRILGAVRNINQNILFVNRDAFRAVGMDDPPERWDFDTFERIGKEYDRRANGGNARRDKYFIDHLGGGFEVLRRSVGASVYNETLTGPAVNTPSNVALFTRIRKWLQVDHLAPSSAERASFTVDKGYGSASFQLFHRGDLALMPVGRWALVQMRRMGPRNLGGVEFPHGGFPNVLGWISGVGVYAKSPHRAEAMRFLEYLSSPGHNRLVAEESDAMPADPATLRMAEMLRPAGHTNEWAYQSACARLTEDLVIGREISPFVTSGTLQRDQARVIDSFMVGLTDPETTLRNFEEAIQKNITETLRRHPQAQARFEIAQRRQKEIDALKRDGRKVPLALVDNPFLSVYYKKTGRGE